MGATLVVVLIGLGALAAGILIGRYYVPDDRHLRRTARHSRAYMRALNHLIARDHVTVIDELRKVVEENIDDVEPYFALAALFRSRGEHERSIRVHQALAVREGASRKHRVRALYELGLDFRAAGMPRRAGRAMEDVLVEEPRHQGALRALCGLYEEQGRYLEAAKVWQRLSKLHGEPPTSREHHLWVAAAQTAIADGDLDSGKRLLKDARRTRGETGHFYAAAAELAAARGNHKAARERLRQAIGASPELTRFFVGGLIEAERGILVTGEGLKSIVYTGRAIVEDDLDEKTPLPQAPPTADALAAGEGSGVKQLPAPATALAVPAAGALVPTTGAGAASTGNGVTDETVRRAAAATLAALETESPGKAHVALARAEVLGPIDPAGALAIHERLLVEHKDLLPTRVTAAKLALEAGDVERVKKELVALTGALGWAIEGRWRCEHCGRRDPAFAWRCAQCRRWGTARVDVGVEPPSAPRERRERSRDVSLPGLVDRAALLGDSATAALPEPSLDHGLSADELTRARVRPSVLGRVGGWFSGAWQGIRGKKKSD